MTQPTNESPAQKDELAPIIDPYTGEVEQVPDVEQRGRQGFLPIRTNTFDRYFISVVVFVAIHLAWMRLLEAYLPLWIATILSLVAAFLIVRWG